MIAAAAAPGPVPAPAVRVGWRAWYIILVLTLAYTASFVDRQVLNLLVGPIKADYGLTDTRLSLLQGLAFTISYIIMSPIFGRLADTGNRRRILMFGVALWSVGTMFCGLARNYTELFLARLGVGGAEACLTPASWSIITDSFPASMLPRAFSIYMMGPYLGGGLALIFGGLLLEHVGGWDLSAVPLLAGLAPWQLVFIIVGLPGVVIALMLGFVREPARAGAAERESMDLRDVWRLFVEKRDFYLNFYLGMSCLVILLYAFPAWMPAVLMRQFGASPGEVGLAYGGLVLVTGSLGVLTGPLVARLLGRRLGGTQLMLVPVVSAGLLVLVCATMPLAATYGQALAVAAVASFLYSIPQALAASALQLATPNRMRGIASAVYVFAVSVIGLGAAPTIVALITDRVFQDEARVGSALALSCGTAALAALFFLFRARAALKRMAPAA